MTSQTQSFAILMYEFTTNRVDHLKRAPSSYGCLSVIRIQLRQLWMIMATTFFTAVITDQVMY